MEEATDTGTLELVLERSFPVVVTDDLEDDLAAILDADFFTD